ncbi:MAG: tetratricopeptide repeat protein [Nitrospirota bacterium]|nr:MAG: tetratricopeptide repeat protein [Nitrospirota bacterium]
MTVANTRSWISQHKKGFLAAIISLLSAFIYLYTLRSGFIWDDVNLILRPLSLGEDPYKYIFSGRTYFRPVLMLANALDYSLWHINPVGYHVTNIFLYMVNVLLVFIFCYQLLKRKLELQSDISGVTDNENRVLWVSFGAAVVFAVHPVHIESVAWISGRTDILATIFVLLAFLSFMEFERDKRWVALALSGLFFFAAMLSKENSVAFIGIVLIYGLVTGMQKRRVFLSLGSMFLVFAVYFFFRNGSYLVNRFVSSPGSEKAFFAATASVGSLVERLVMGMGYYFEKLIMPLDLSLMPSVPDSAIYYLIFLIPVIGAAYLYKQGRKFELMMVLWIVITLSPSILILFSKLASPIAERYLYMPTVGLCCLLGIFAVEWNRKIIVSVMTVLVVLYGILFLDRIKDWGNDRALWMATVKSNPEAVAARINYGAALVRDGEMDEARKEMLGALSEKNITVSQASLIFETLGHIEFKTENYERAAEHMTAALNIKPGNAISLNNLGLVYYMMSGKSSNEEERMALLNKAKAMFERAIQRSDRYMMARYYIALCYLMMDDYVQAEKFFRDVIELDPQSIQAKNSARFIHLLNGPDKYKVIELIKNGGG